MEKKRYLTKEILEDLKEKMVFIGGARQVGKTTLAKSIISKHFKNSFYYNWDYKTDRTKIFSSELPGSKGLLIFDEIHKYKKWKNFVKGIYDVKKDKYKIIVTGSARLNIYRKGGDSLQGRYHYYTLFPFTLAEILNKKKSFEIFNELNIPNKNAFDDLSILFNFGGFPEVLLKQNNRFKRRWQNEKLERLFREDIRDVENIRDLSSIKLLGDLLPQKVASQLSINSLREDLDVSHRAVTSWLNILEAFYYHFRIYPFNSNIIRSIKKEPKLYLIDWAEVGNKGAKFENMIAVHLLKFVQYISEYEGYKIHLNYLRNVDQKETDFIISIDNKPWFAVEVKLSDTQISKNLIYFRDKLKIPFAFQVVFKKNIDFIKDDVRVVSADKFLLSLI